MLRHLAVVLLAAIIGSSLGTLVMEAIFRAAGEPSPFLSVVAIAGGTLFFSVPGAILLMALTFAFAHRKRTLEEIRVPLTVIGTLVGAAMLGLSGTFKWALIGALYGGLTTIAFITLLALLKAYPGDAALARAREEKRLMDPPFRD